MLNLLLAKPILAAKQVLIKTLWDKFYKQHHRSPQLVIYQIGEDDASSVYIKHKKAFCEANQILCHVRHLAATVILTEVLTVITESNADPLIDGILVQLPLPSHLDKLQVLNAISPQKDVDALTSPWYASLAKGQTDLILPATCASFQAFIDFYQIQLRSKNVLIIGTGLIAGRPIGLYCLNQEATVQFANKATKNLLCLTKNADIIVIAIGVANFLTCAMVKPTAIIFDVGINRFNNLNTSQIVGDVDIDSFQNNLFDGHITPVPGGIGPLTITCLVINLLQLGLNVNVTK